MSEETQTFTGPTMPIPLPNDPGGPTYIPEFSPRYSDVDLSHHVTLDGEDLGFCVGDIHPARRWACSKVVREGGQPRLIPSDGELLPETDFIQFYRRWSARVCVPDGRVIALASVSKYHHPEFEPIPSAKGFVNYALDSEGKPCEIGFDPHKPAKTSEKKLFRADGEEFDSGERDLVMKMKGIQEAFSLGAIDEAQRDRAVGALIGGAQQVPPQPSEMPAGFDSVKESDEVGNVIEPEETQPEDPNIVKTLCGTELTTGLRGKKAHERKCKVCLQLKAEEQE